MLQPEFLVVSEGNHCTVIKLQGYAPTRPCLGGLLGSSSTVVRKVKAASWGCHSGRSTLLSVSSKWASCLACKLFAACDAACCFCLVLVTCSDFSLVGNVKEYIYYNNSAKVFERNKVWYLHEKRWFVGLPLNCVYTALLRAISGFYLNVPTAVEVHLQEIK